MQVLDFLAICERVFEFTNRTWEAAKQAARIWLGPGPADFFLIPDTDIVFPAAFQHPSSESLQLFMAEKGLIGDSVGTSDIRRRLPWLNVVYSGAQLIDMSDWVTEIRWSGAKEPSLLQIVRLYGQVHGVFLAEDAAAVIEVITRQGEEESWRFVGNVGLQRM